MVGRRGPILAFAYKKEKERKNKKKNGPSIRPSAFPESFRSLHGPTLLGRYPISTSTPREKVKLYSPGSSHPVIVGYGMLRKLFT